MILCRISILLFFIFISVFLFTGCPHQVVPHLDKMFIDLDKSIDEAKQDRKPYKTSIVDINSLEKKDSLLTDSINIHHNNMTGDFSEELLNEDSTDTLNIQQEETFGINFQLLDISSENYPNEITLKAVVYDNAGRYISGLAPPYISEDKSLFDYWTFLSDSCRGNLAQINNFKVEEIRSHTAEPHSLAFVLDHSPSMGHKRALLLQNAVSRILKIVKKSDYVSIVKFTRHSTIEIPLTNNKIEINNNFIIDGLKGNYSDGTAIYDAGLAGINEIIKAPDTLRRVMIIFTDGMDNMSKSTVFDMLQKAKEEKVKVYTIAYGLASTDTMRIIANETGGKFYHILSSKEFPYVFLDIYLSLNNYYKITYTPPECAGLHFVNSKLELPLLVGGPLTINAAYDKSIFSVEDTIGTIAFFNIEFGFAKYEVSKNSMPILEEIAETLKQNESIKIMVAGHTDDIGRDDFNLNLSEKRAEAVKNELVKMGIAQNRIQTKGFGKNKPLVPNDSDENRKINRRTEFIIIDR